MSRSRANPGSAFLVRVGTLIASPGRALADVEARGSDGVGDAFVILLVGVLCGRLPAVVRTLLMVRDASFGGMLTQMLAIVGADLRPALLVVLSAGVGITLLAGRGRRDPGLDIELGATCSIPYLLLSGLNEWARSPALRGVTAGVLGSIIHLIALAWTLALFVLAARLTRRRPVGAKPGTAAPAVESRGEPASLARREPSREGMARPSARARAQRAGVVEGVLVPKSPQGEASGEVWRVGGRRAKRTLPGFPYQSTTRPRRARVAAIIVGSVLAGALAVNIVWLSHNPDAVAPVGRGVLAPDFELPRIDGTPGRVSLHQLRGKVVLLDFWARWCPPCMALMPTLHDIYAARRSQDVEFLAISSEGSMADRVEIEAFLRQAPTPYPSLLDDREVGGLYRVVSLPHLVVIGRDGVIRRVMVGQRQKAELEAEIQRAVDN